MTEEIETREQIREQILNQINKYLELKTDEEIIQRAIINNMTAETILEQALKEKKGEDLLQILQFAMEAQKELREIEQEMKEQDKRSEKKKGGEKK